MVPRFTQTALALILGGLFLVTISSAEAHHTEGHGGGPPSKRTPSATATNTKTPIPSLTSVAVPSATVTATPTLTSTPRATPTLTSTPTRTSTPAVQATIASTAASADPCSETLQAKIDRAADGATINLPPCVYRETITFRRPVRLLGGSRAEVRGTDVWTQWTGSGPWTSAQSLPQIERRVFGTGEQQPPTCADGSDTTCNQAHQVWLDGQWLRHVDRTPGPGEWTLDGRDGGRVILGSNPNGRTVEVATRRHWAHIPAGVSGVYVHGITFRHSQGTLQWDAFRIDGSNSTLEHNSFFNAGYAAIRVNGPDNKLIDNEISWNGAMAVSAERATRLLWKGGTIQFNNRRALYGQALADWSYGWEPSGSKIVLADHVTVQSVQSYHNGGPGLWCDIRCGAITYVGNISAFNLWDGILIEGPVGPFDVGGNSTHENLYCGIRVVTNEAFPNAQGQVLDNSSSNNGGPPTCRGYDTSQQTVQHQPNVVIAGTVP